MDFTKLFQKIRELDQSSQPVQEGDAGWDDPRYEKRRPESDEDWEYEKYRQDKLDNPEDSSPYQRYEPSDAEREAEKEYQREKAEKLSRVMAMQDEMYRKIYGKKKESVEEQDESITEIEGEIEECGMDMMPPKPMDPMKQQDSVTMNVSMNGSGAGGIRDLMNILKNLEDTPKPDFPSMPPMMKKSMDKTTILGTEEFANSPDEKVAPMSAVIATGDDLHSKGGEAPKVNGGGNPMSLAARLESLYNEVKSR